MNDILNNDPLSFCRTSRYGYDKNVIQSINKLYNVLNETAGLIDYGTEIVQLFNEKNEDVLINNIRNKANTEDILNFLYSNAYLLNTSEIQAKLEDYYIDIKQFGPNMLAMIRNIMPGIYNYLPRVSKIAELYLQLYKTIILIRDNYNQSKIDQDIDKLSVLENLYHTKFNSMFDVLNFFCK